MKTAIDSAEFRRAMGHFPTGVTVITTLDGDGQPYGITVSSFASLSLDPPLVQWSIKGESFSMPIFAGAERFAVNVLAAGQEEVSKTFSRPVDRFKTVEWAEGEGRIPLILGCLAWVECTREHILKGGDHRIVVGRVVRTRAFDRGPLIHWKGQYARLSCAGQTWRAAS